jgi:hypothetical protein
MLKKQGRMERTGLKSLKAGFDSGILYEVFKKSSFFFQFSVSLIIYETFNFLLMFALVISSSERL